jgi:hypothetical protein
MAIIVLIDAHKGDLDRYEIGGESYRKTHACTYRKSVTFTQALIESFRVNPPSEFAVDHDPRPTGPNAGAGTISKAA